MADLTVIIPARNEMFLQKTIEDILENSEVDTEIIAVCDGYWPNPPIKDHPKVRIIHNTTPRGQRKSFNDGVRLSQSKYVMKTDAHCAFDKGFDRKLMATMRSYWTVIPRMYNLHAFNWKCNLCGHESYQGKKPDVCEGCEKQSDFEMVLVWKPKPKPVTDAMRFDKNMQFQYWEKYKKKQNPKAYPDIVDTMSFIGACWMMERKRHDYLEGLDENHGSWGQVGTEIACKTWLSGGRLCVNRGTWFAHLFRTGNFKGAFDGGSSFPYEISGNQQEHSKEYSRDLWLNDKWPKAIHPLSWLIDKFAPVPGWGP